MTLWPNGLRTIPNVTTEWMGYPGHNGIDLIDFDINRSIEAGSVIFAAWNKSGAGYEVKVVHDSGDVTRYLHNADLLVTPGELVVEGQALGIQGSTGDSSGKHLHFEVWVGGSVRGRVNPRPYMEARVGTSSAGADFEIIPEKPKPTGVPMFNLVLVPDEGLVYVQGLDGRRVGVQGGDHLDALLRYRDAMLTPGAPLVMYFGDLIGQRGAIDWYLGQVNGPRNTAAPVAPAPYKFTADELAKIGAGIQVDVSGIVAQITALDKQADDYQAKLTALLNREFVITPKQ